jgi:hypothetical protein
MEFSDLLSFVFPITLLLIAILTAVALVWKVIRDIRYKHKHIRILSKHRGYHGRWKVRLEHNSDTQLFSIYREDERAFIGAVRTTYSRWDTADKEEAFSPSL